MPSPSYPQSLIAETDQTDQLSTAEYATQAGIPLAVAEALRAGVPWSGIDAHFRTLYSALGESAIVIRARVEAKRNQIWHQTGFENQDRAVFAGLKARSLTQGGNS